MGTKRNFVRSGGPVFYHKWGEWNAGESVSGVLVGTSIDKKYKRTNYHVKVEEFDIDCTNQNDEPIKEGDTLVLNGCGILEKHLSNCDKGDAVQVVYQGMVEVTKGENAGTEAHSIEVYLDEPKLSSKATPEDDDDYGL